MCSYFTFLNVQGKGQENSASGSFLLVGAQWKLTFLCHSSLVNKKSLSLMFAKSGDILLNFSFNSSENLNPI